jgi:hypothetical protein
MVTILLEGIVSKPLPWSSMMVPGRPLSGIKPVMVIPVGVIAGLGVAVLGAQPIKINIPRPKRMNKDLFIADSFPYLH